MNTCYNNSSLSHNLTREFIIYFQNACVSICNVNIEKKDCKREVSISAPIKNAKEVGMGPIKNLDIRIREIDASNKV